MELSSKSGPLTLSYSLELSTLKRCKTGYRGQAEKRVRGGSPGGRPDHRRAAQVRQGHREIPKLRLRRVQVRSRFETGNKIKNSQVLPKLLKPS